MYCWIARLEKPTNFHEPSNFLDGEFDLSPFANIQICSDVVRHENSTLVVMAQNKRPYRFCILGIFQLHDAIARDSTSVLVVEAHQQTAVVGGRKRFHRQFYHQLNVLL